MYTETEGIILRQTKIAGGKRMVVLFSEKYGKISAGTSISEKSKNKSSLAIRPFTRGRYELYKIRDTYTINSAQTVHSFYSIGEDIDKYIHSAYVLELCDKLLVENEEAAAMYKLLISFLELISSRKKEFETLVLGFIVKAMNLSGLCISQNPLANSLGSDKITIVKYMESHPLSALEKLSVSEEPRRVLMLFVKQYLNDNLGINNLNSELISIQKGDINGNNIGTN